VKAVDARERAQAREAVREVRLHLGGFGAGERPDDEPLKQVARQARAFVEPPQQPLE
jgi:hypothetical protein